MYREARIWTTTHAQKEVKILKKNNHRTYLHFGIKVFT